MSDAYERERQNNARLEELSAKVSSLRGVTVDIYDNARAQDVIDNTVLRHLLVHVHAAKGLRRSPRPRRRLGNKIAIFKLSAVIIGAFLVLYWLYKLFFRGSA
ncbi:hypothetical protein PG987_000398 [Apiospora arundinis]